MQYNRDLIKNPLKWWQELKEEIAKINTPLDILCGVGSLRILHALFKLNPDHTIQVNKNKVQILHLPTLDSTELDLYTIKGLPLTSFTVVGMSGADTMFKFEIER